MFWFLTPFMTYFFPQAAITCCASGMCPLVATAAVTTAPALSIFALPLSILAFLQLVLYYFYKKFKGRMDSLVNKEKTEEESGGEEPPQTDSLLEESTLNHIEDISLKHLECYDRLC